ncbi:MAG: alpha/beta hydrolase [Dehalococcoidia bacterium]
MEDFATKRLVEIGDATVCYRKTGSGPALVLLHGFPLSGLTWRNVVPPLAPRFTCYAFDLVGLGDSTSTEPADFSSPGQARLFQQALAAEGVTSYDLMGNNTGGWIARELALLDRERVTHLALTNTEIPGHRPPWIPLYQFLVRLPGSGLVMKRMLLSRRFRRSPMGFGGCFEDLDFIDGEFHEFFVPPLVSSPQHLDSMFQFLKEMRFSRIDQFAKLHSELSMPVTFLWGDADPTFPEHRARDMANQFPNVRDFRTLPNAKLFFYEEHPEAVANWLLEFLT